MTATMRKAILASHAFGPAQWWYMLIGAIFQAPTPAR